MSLRILRGSNFQKDLAICYRVLGVSRSGKNVNEKPLDLKLL